MSWLKEKTMMTWQMSTMGFLRMNGKLKLGKWTVQLVSWILQKLPISRWKTLLVKEFLSLEARKSRMNLSKCSDLRWERATPSGRSVKRTRRLLLKYVTVYFVLEQYSRLQGMMIVLELCLSQPSARDEIFSALLETLGYNTVRNWRIEKSVSQSFFKASVVLLGDHNIQSKKTELWSCSCSLQVTFWKSVVPQIYNSDLSYATQYREALLFSLVLYDVNHSKNRLRELYAAVPGVRQSMLGIRAKQFGERYRHLQMKVLTCHQSL